MSRADTAFRPLLGPILVTGVLAGLAGCALGPDYHRPTVDSPASFRFAQATTNGSFADLQWWEAFRDPQLQDLIRTALTNSYDLQRTVARVEQAREQVTVARAPLFPQIGYGGDVGRGRNSEFNGPAPLNGATESSAVAGVNAVWEIDFWGRIRRLTQAARAQYLATDEARRGVTLTLISDVASTYVQLLGVDQELSIQRAATNAYAGTYRIFNERRVNGVASRLETDRAAAALATASASIPQLELQAATLENRINLLLGRPPGPIVRTTLTQLPPFPPEIPVGLPSDLLQRRPDVLAAEQALVAANATVGASFASFFPQIGLTTFLGKVSPELSAFTSGTANAWNVGATLAGPIFQGGQLRAQYRAAKAAFDEALAGYQQTVIAAFQEVSDTLIARQKLGEVETFVGQASAALSESVEVSTERYLTGKASYFEVLQAQQELYPSQRAQVQAQVGQLLATIQLYRALGGGWPSSQIPAPASR